MKKYWKHFATITKHKWYVGIECFKRGLYWQGLVHDLSKYYPAEFCSSARMFQGDKSPIKAEKIELGYSYAWLNHKAKNKHHWHYWVDIEKGKMIAAPMPEKYIQEMLCDWIGAGKAYNKEKWTKEEPLNYYEKVGHTMILAKETRERFYKLIIDFAYD